MNISEIYSEYTPGSEGFVAAVETHCGYEISREEIARIADTADKFQSIWENDDSWSDEKQ